MSFKNKQDLLESIKNELILRKDFLKGKKLDSIYIGGGTPSVLKIDELDELFETIYKHYAITYNPEITLEANPDDINKEYIHGLLQLGVNRLSIGIQSFNDNDLQLMNRRHNAIQAERTVNQCFDEGFKNITVDLIYGLPDQTIEKWETNLEKVFSLPIKHLSAYNLTVEKQTAFYKFSKHKQIVLPQEQVVIDQYLLLKEYAKEYSFVHYEISNFGMGNYFSKHNISYWQQKHYLGIGPSAHSYNGKQRFWNIANNIKYIAALQNDMLPITSETLNKTDIYNEYVFTSLRTMWGIDMDKVKDNIGKEFYSYLKKNVQKYIKNESIININNFLLLTERGKLLADNISSDLFYIDKL